MLEHFQAGGERLGETSALDQMEATLDEALTDDAGFSMYTQEGVHGVATDNIKTVLAEDNTNDFT